jgi:glycyl-tRNA synthetase
MTNTAKSNPAKSSAAKPSAAIPGTSISIDEMATFCKRKGFVYPNSEIYGGMAGFFDYGPLGVELNNNIKQQWWKVHVHNREDIVGIDGSIIASPKIWQASGHVQNFEDILVECKKCHERYKAEALVEEVLKIQAGGLSEEDFKKLIKENNIRCQKCKSEFEDPSAFNLMFITHTGPKQTEESIAYLRPETAQLMFADFKLVAENARLKLPFGIAQVGKAFRNEISPRNFLFRAREFEQMEIEYFIHPEQKDCPYIDEYTADEINVLSADMQEKKEAMKKMKIKDLLAKKIIKSQWHAFWLAHELRWFKNLGANPDHFRVRQHSKDELAHYSSDCWDVEYNFPFGWRELEGVADRSDYDLQQHIKTSKKDLSLFDEETKKKVVPHVVAEPSLGVGRAFLVFMYDAYNDDKERGNIVLKLHPKLAPTKVGVFPLVNKLEKEARGMFAHLKEEFNCTYDRSGSIGRRYARADESGIPYCVTIDFDFNEHHTVTIRDRNTTKQIIVKEHDLKNVLNQLMNAKIDFEHAGKLVEQKE